MRPRTFYRWLGFALALPIVADAQPSAAEEHLRRGVELRRGGHDEESVAEFEEAYRLVREPRTAAQLGLVRQALGRWLDADRLLREALASPDEPWVARNRAALEAALDVVGGHLGQVEVRGNVPGAEVRIDAAAVATLPMSEPARVLAGMVSLEVVARGYEPVSRRFMVEPRALVRESVEFRPTPTPPPALPVVLPPPVVVPPRLVVVPVRDEGAATRRVWGIASLASAAAVLGFGGVALALGEDAATQYNAHQPPCPSPPAPSGTPCADLEDTTSRWRVTGAITLSIGAALAVTGAVLLLLPSRAVRRASAISCAPFATGSGLTCGFAF